MFLWFGIDVDEYLSKLKEKAEKIENEMGYAHSNFTLPLHISLKISFEADASAKDDIVNDVVRLFSETKPFFVKTDKIEREDNICWLRYRENDALLSVQKRLNELLNKKHGIPYHAYDLDFKFHTTLFMDDDTEKVALSYEKIKDEKFPDTVYAKRFLLGRSENGDIGTYEIFGEVTTK